MLIREVILIFLDSLKSSMHLSNHCLLVVYPIFILRENTQSNIASIFDIFPTTLGVKDEIRFDINQKKISLF